MRPLKNYIPSPTPLHNQQLDSDYAQLLTNMAAEAYERRNLERYREGWQYGDTYDEEQKKSPDMLPFHHLPQQQRNLLTSQMRENLQYLQYQGYRLTTDEQIIAKAENEVKAMKPRSLYAHISKSFWLILGVETLVSVALFWHINGTYFFSPTSCLTLLCFIFFSCFIGYFIISLMKNAISKYNSEYELYLRYKQAWLDKKAGFLPQKN